MTVTFGRINRAFYATNWWFYQGKYLYKFSNSIVYLSIGLGWFWVRVMR
jgi:hypothetical protein